MGGGLCCQSGVGCRGESKRRCSQGVSWEVRTFAGGSCLQGLKPPADGQWGALLVMSTLPDPREQGERSSSCPPSPSET